MFNKYCCFLFLVVFIFSCKKKEEVDPVENVQVIIDAYARYEQDKSLLKTDISFQAGKYREHGIAAQLNGDAFLNDFKIQKVPLKRKYTKYNLKQTTPTPESYRYFFDLDNGKKVEIEVPYAQIDTFFLSKTSFSENEGIIIHWKGKALEEGETILVMFTDAQGTIKPWSLTGPSQKDKIFIPQELIYTLANGTGTVYLTRRKKYKGIKDIIDYIITTEFATPTVVYEVL